MPETTKKNLEPVNLGSIARGALMEIFETEIQKIAANIADPNTRATKKRELVLKITFEPDQDRRSIDVVTTSSTKLAGLQDHASRLYLGKDGDNHAYLFNQDPRQELLFEPPPADNNLISFQPGTAQA